MANPTKSSSNIRKSDRFAGRAVSALAARAATVSIVSGISFAVLLGLLHVLEPEFDPGWRFVSEYQLGDFGILMHLAFFALAASLAGAGLHLWSQARTVVGYIGNVGLFIAALGILVAGIFTTDPISTARSAMTTSGTMHVFGASLDYSPVAMLLLSFSLVRFETWRRCKAWLFTAAAITVACMFGFIFALPKDGVFDPSVHAGLAGRILLVSYLLWLIPAGLHTLKLRRQASAKR